MLLLILGIIFVLGWPLEWVPIVLIVVPIMLPLVQKLGIDLVWFCTLVAVCLQTAWLSPPVALSAYFLKGVVPDWDLADIYAGMMQFMVLQIIGLLLLLAFPQLACGFPRRCATDPTAAAPATSLPRAISAKRTIVPMPIALAASAKRLAARRDHEERRVAPGPSDSDRRRIVPSPTGIAPSAKPMKPPPQCRLPVAPHQRNTSSDAASTTTAIWATSIADSRPTTPATP
jgi:hypothetical protein